MIEVTVREDFENNRKVVTAYVPYVDLDEIKLDEWDKLVLRTPAKGAADIFQDLEILARRQAEQRRREVSNG